MSGYIRNHRIGILLGTVIILFTAYTFLDTFVIPHRQAVVDDEDYVYTGDIYDDAAETADDITPAEPDTQSPPEESSAPETENVTDTQTGGQTSASPVTTSVAPSSSPVTTSSPTPSTSPLTSPVTTPVVTTPATTPVTAPVTTPVTAPLTEATTAAVGINLREPNSIIGSYKDENISITLGQYREYNTEIYVADIMLSSPDYLKTAFAKSTFGTNVKDKTSSTAAAKNAILAINGDYYGARKSGYVIRNGKVYRSTVYKTNGIANENLLIYGNGSFSIITEGSVTADSLVASGVKTAFSFGPGLIKNGAIAVSATDEVGKAMASNPRTAIAEFGSGSLHYLMVVSDGRTSASTGLSLYELAEFLQSLGVTTAYNLDGGGSSTMYFDGKVINNPTTTGKIAEREVSDIVYIGY